MNIDSNCKLVCWREISGNFIYLIYKIMSPVVFLIENMNRGLAVAWKYGLIFSCKRQPEVHIFYMEQLHNMGDMNFVLNLYNVKTK